MKKFARIVDEQGMFIEDAFVKELNEFTIEEACPSGFYHPKWDGEKWIEGLTAEEIQARKQKPDYATLVQNMIAEKYTIEQELALHRQRETKAREFQDYFDYCEECKTIAREALEIPESSDPTDPTVQYKLNELTETINILIDNEE